MRIQAAFAAAVVALSVSVSGCGGSDDPTAVACRAIADAGGDTSGIPGRLYDKAGTSFQKAFDNLTVANGVLVGLSDICESFGVEDFGVWDPTNVACRAIVDAEGDLSAVDEALYGKAATEFQEALDALRSDGREVQYMLTGACRDVGVDILPALVRHDIDSRFG